MSFEWLASSPSLRRVFIRMMRVYMRLRRATIARAVLVARRRDGRVLLTRSELGGAQLPSLQLDAWTDIETQVHSWLRELFDRANPACLAAIDGTPRTKGMTFVYLVELESDPPKTHQALWSELESAVSCLGAEDSRVLMLAETYRQAADAKRARLRAESDSTE